jgi:tRNA(His) guanylyltransferase
MDLNQYKRDLDNLGDLMKIYEGKDESNLLPGIPIVVRLDGRAFHTFTADLEKPFDGLLTNNMIETTKHLVKEFRANLGYTQSDEITLIFENPLPETTSTFSKMDFSGRIQKLSSVFAATCSVKFNNLLASTMPAKVDSLPIFDCRIFNVPTKELAVLNVFWRYCDAVKNSVSMAASAYYTHNELMNKSAKQKIEMLHQKGVNFGLYDEKYKSGSFILNKKLELPLTEEDLAKVPEHKRDSLVNQTFMRSVIFQTTFNRMNNIDNWEGIFFDKNCTKAILVDGSELDLMQNVKPKKLTV